MQSSNQLMYRLRQLQSEMSAAQNAISSGQQVNKPSDAPTLTSAILLVAQQMEARNQHENNLDYITTMLNNVDQAMADMSTIANESHSLALSQIGIASDPGTRESEASVVDAQISALLDIVNRSVLDIGLFNGNANSGNQAFTEFMGGIRYVGATSNLVAETGLSNPVSYNSNGAEALNALGYLYGSVDLNPAATSSTRLKDADGVTSQGIRLGTMQIEVDGIKSSVDLSSARTFNDVVLRIQDAIDNIDPSAGQIEIAEQGFDLSANGGHTISLSDLPGGVVASDLGIEMTASDGDTVNGQDVQVNLTMSTSIDALDFGIDWDSGLKITQGGTTKIADFSQATTIQDLVNVIDGLHMGVRMQINGDGSALDFINEVSGIDLSIGENDGGTTATDLGLRTFDTSTLLSSFNHGIGVDRAAGLDDIGVQLHDGSTFNINLDEAATVEDVMNMFRQAAEDAGLSVGEPGDGASDVNIGFAADGNGLVIEDNTFGDEDFKVAGLNQSSAAEDLGIAFNAKDEAIINGEDNAKVQVDSIFTHLINLKESLLQDDSRGIRLATSKLESDTSSVTEQRATIGVRTQRAEDALDRSSELGISEASLLSDLQGGDLSELILKYQNLQYQLQASLSVGAQNLQMSLLDYLA
jgi:flagellar hook-associated protein 3 FlgL